MKNPFYSPTLADIDTRETGEKFWKEYYRASDTTDGSFMGEDRMIDVEVGCADVTSAKHMCISTCDLFPCVAIATSFNGKLAIGKNQMPGLYKYVSHMHPNIFEGRCNTSELCQEFKDFMAKITDMENARLVLVSSESFCKPTLSAREQLILETVTQAFKSYQQSHPDFEIQFKKSECVRIEPDGQIYSLEDLVRMKELKQTSAANALLAEK